MHPRGRIKPQIFHQGSSKLGERSNCENQTQGRLPWGGADPPGVAYVYAPDRKADRPIAHLAGFKGILQDGYAGYAKLAERGEIALAFWAHMRRNFYELATLGPAPIASEALKHIAALYAIEKDIRGCSAEERRLIRQQSLLGPVV